MTCPTLILTQFISICEASLWAKATINAGWDREFLSWTGKQIALICSICLIWTQVFESVCVICIKMNQDKTNQV